MFYYKLSPQDIVESALLKQISLYYLVKRSLIKKLGLFEICLNILFGETYILYKIM